MTAFVATQALAIVTVSLMLDRSALWILIVLVVPLVVWTQPIGFVICVQHTHSEAWFREKREWRGSRLS